jgi:hypothetical protein
MAKAKSNRKKKTQARNRPRAMALGIAEPTLRGPRQQQTQSSEQSRSPAEMLGPAPSRLPEQSHAGAAGSPAQTPGPLPLDAITLAGSSWITMLCQQALVARGLLSVMEAQIQFWSLPARLALQLGRR